MTTISGNTPNQAVDKNTLDAADLISGFKSLYPKEKEAIQQRLSPQGIIDASRTHGERLALVAA